MPHKPKYTACSSAAEDQGGGEQEPDRQNPSREELGADIDLLAWAL